MNGPRPPASPAAAAMQSLARDARAALVDGRDEAARAAYDEIVGLLQRRASRLAFYYLRNAEDADEAVQDAFVKAFMHLRSYNDDYPFEAWFTRILVNGCLDRLKARRRRWKWLPGLDNAHEEGGWREPMAADPSPEDRLVSRETRETLGDAIDKLPERQRTVVLLTHFDGRTPREIARVTGMSEATVRVHLFRALRRLRAWLSPAASASVSRKVEG